MGTFLVTESGMRLDVSDRPFNGGAEADIFAAGEFVAKRFKDRDAGRRRVRAAQELARLAVGPLQHPAVAPLVLPVDTIADLNGSPAIVLPRVPASAIDGMKLVLPGEFTALPMAQRGGLKERCVLGARYAAAVPAFSELTGGGCLPDGGLRNMMLDLQRERLWMVDIESAVLPGHTREGLVSTFQFDAPELSMGSPPSSVSDRHMVAVTLHFLLLGRHPFVGSRPDPPEGAAVGEWRDFVTDPLWTDDPDDRSNAAGPGLILPWSLGADVAALFWKAFAKRSSSAARPDGRSWAQSLIWLTDRLVPCPTDECWWGAVPWTSGTELVRCPVCGQCPRGGSQVLVLEFVGDDGSTQPHEVMVVGGQRRNLFERHTRRSPGRLHGDPVGHVRRRLLRQSFVAEVEGGRAVPLTPGEVAVIGERRVKVHAAPSRMLAA